MSLLLRDRDVPDSFCTALSVLAALLPQPAHQALWQVPSVPPALPRPVTAPEAEYSRVSVWSRSLQGRNTWEPTPVQTRPNGNSEQENAPFSGWDIAALPQLHPHDAPSLVAAGVGEAPSLCSHPCPWLARCPNLLCVSAS